MPKGLGILQPRRVAGRNLADMVGHSSAHGVGVVAAPVNSVAPVISGTPTVGQLLSTTTGTWSGSPTFDYQWTAGGTPISGATASTFTLTYSEEGQDIRCEVTATNAGGSAVAASNALTFAAIELVANGDFNSAVGWTLPTGFSIDTGTGELVIASPAGFSTASRTALNPPNFVPGVTYTALVNITAFTSGSLRFSITGGTAVGGIYRTGTGPWMQDFVALTGNANVNIQVGAGSCIARVGEFSVKKK